MLRIARGTTQNSPCTHLERLDHVDFVPESTARNLKSIDPDASLPSDDATPHLKHGDGNENGLDGHATDGTDLATVA